MVSASLVNIVGRDLMNDETLQLIIAGLRLMGNNSTPGEIEVEYLKAGKLVSAYRTHLAEHPAEDPRRSFPK
jgi:hypothetical protein